VVDEADGEREAEEPAKPEEDEAAGEKKEKKTVFIVQEIGTKLSEQQIRKAYKFLITNYNLKVKRYKLQVTVTTIKLVAAIKMLRTRYKSQFNILYKLL
jgi:hypothetical protein